MFFLFQEYTNIFGNSLGHHLHRRRCLLVVVVVVAACQPTYHYTFYSTQYKYSWSRPVAHLCSTYVQYFVSDEVWGNVICRHMEQIRIAALSMGTVLLVKPDCRYGTSSISIEPDQPVSNVLLERNNSNTISVAQKNLINMIHCIHKILTGFIL